MTPATYREYAPPPGLEALVAGPATAATLAPATPGQARVGARFRVGAAGAALGVPASELRDQGVPLAELWGTDARRMEDRVVAAHDERAALLALIGGIAQRLPAPEDADHEVRRAALALARPGDPFKAPASAMRHAPPMTDIAAAAQFIHGHGRLLERRRFEHLFGTTHASAGAVLRAVDAYRNADGGVGFMEPDLRTPASQPSAVLYAFEVLEEIPGLASKTTTLTTGALDWLQTITNADGGIPFVLPTAKGWPHAPWWTPTDDPPSSLLMTAGVAAAAYRLQLNGHPWIDKATNYVWNALADLQLSDAYAFRYAVHFLDAVSDRARADLELDALRERMPGDGILKVEAGVEGETLSALEIAPRPGHAGRALFPDALVDAQLDDLAAAQKPDGGWDFTWAAWNPAVAFEWRGMVTLNALTTLRAYGRLDSA